jgi:hypothetical protein
MNQKSDGQTSISRTYLGTEVQIDSLPLGICTCTDGNSSAETLFFHASDFLSAYPSK